jgi:hypothetical protein
VAVAVAVARDWKALRVSGNEEFKRMVCSGISALRLTRRGSSKASASQEKTPGRSKCFYSTSGDAKRQVRGRKRVRTFAASG